MDRWRGSETIHLVGEYVLGEFERERERLQRIGAIHDPVTFRHLDALGVRDGWVCAEIGGGAGAVARWLCERTAPSGRVLVTDLDTRFLEQLAAVNLEVRRHDIADEPLDAGVFDLIHTRLVLMHVPARARALEHIVAGLKPGGRLLIEEPDFSSMQSSHPHSPPVERMMGRVLEAFDGAAADWGYGLKVPVALEALGIEEIVAEGELSVMPFGSEQAEALALLFENVGPRLIAAGLLSDGELDDAIEAVRTPAPTVMCSPLVISTRGRKPT